MEFEFQIRYMFLWTNVYQVETDLTTRNVEPIIPLFVTISLVVVTKQQLYQMCRLSCSHYGFIPCAKKVISGLMVGEFMNEDRMCCLFRFLL